MKFSKKKKYYFPSNPGTTFTYEAHDESKFIFRNQQGDLETWSHSHVEDLKEALPTIKARKHKVWKKLQQRYYQMGSMEYLEQLLEKEGLRIVGIEEMEE